MTNFELNLRIYNALVNISYSKYSSKAMPDYCNNWNDLMPLVIEQGIAFGQVSSIESKVPFYQVGRWTMPFNKLPTFASGHVIPQLALAECLLKVLESKNED